MEVDIIYILQDWFEDLDFARVAASSRYLTRLGEGPMANQRSLQGLGKAKPRIRAQSKVGPEIGSHLELSNDFTRFTRQPIIYAINQR